MDNINELFISVMPTNKAEIFEVKGYGAIYANDKAANNFTFFSVHMFCKRYKKTWNQTVTNYHLFTLFLMQYINLIYVIDHVSMSSYVKDKNI